MAASLLTLVAWLMLVLLAALAWCMAFPVRWDGPGVIGAAALHFPLHLLLVTLLAVLLRAIAVGLPSRAASRALAIVILLSVAMAVIPTVATWRQARHLRVPVSLWNYIANGAHFNSGSPRRDRIVLYGMATDGTPLELDVWSTGRPRVGPLRPGLIMVHGGAWTHGHRSMLPEWNRWLNGLGYEVFDVEYRMPPPARWRDEVGDVKTALAWVAAHATQYHVDPARIDLMGGSAGANLALLAAYTVGDTLLDPSTGAPPIAIRCVIDFYGPVDMALMYRACKSPDYCRPLMRDYIGGAPEQYPDRYRLLSPLDHITASAPPTLAFLGTSDRLVTVDHTTLLDRALTSVQVPHEVYLLPANDHGFDVNWGGLATQICRDRMRAFLARYDP